MRIFTLLHNCHWNVYALMRNIQSKMNLKSTCLWTSTLWKTICMLEHIGILSFRNPPGSSAVLHAYQNIHQKMSFADLHFELILFCFVWPSYSRQLCIVCSIYASRRSTQQKPVWARIKVGLANIVSNQKVSIQLLRSDYCERAHQSTTSS